MATDPFVVWGFICFLVSLGLYLIAVFVLRWKEADVADILEMFGAWIAISEAANLCSRAAWAASHHEKIVLEGSDIYLAITGCVALMFISALVVIRAFK
jgi:hypothetical protein